MSELSQAINNDLWKQRIEPKSIAYLFGSGQDGCPPHMHHKPEGCDCGSEVIGTVEFHDVQDAWKVDGGALMYGADAVDFWKWTVER